MKVALCVQIKLENNYIREWIEYHKNLGFDNIVIIDNNNVNTDIINDAINDYIKSNYVIVDNTYYGEKNIQQYSYANCLNQHITEYDWIGFWDLDEFLYLNKFNNIKDFLLSNKNFNECDAIALQWVTYADNGYIEVSSHSVLENFDNPFNISNDISKQSYYKSIFNCHNVINLPNIIFNDAHGLINGDLTMCDVSGNFMYCFNSCIYPNTNDVYLKHFLTKSLSEFIYQKCSRGIYWQIYENKSIYDLYKDINGWCQEYDNYITYYENNKQMTNKKILICIFLNNNLIENVIYNTYIDTINAYDNIDYKIIIDNNIVFNTYYNTFKSIYEETSNKYDVIVCCNQQTFINIHLLNRFINIIYDENTIYTNILQRRASDNNICERFFIISTKYLPAIINDSLYTEKPESIWWYPYYVLNIIFDRNNIQSIKSLGTIDFICNNKLTYELNDRTNSIICWTNVNMISNDNINEINNEYIKINDFINSNKNKFILRLHKINYGHIEFYEEIKSSDKGPGYIYVLNDTNNQ